MSTTEALLAGADMFNAGGLLSSLMAFDFAKAVIDNEIALMINRKTTHSTEGRQSKSSQLIDIPEPVRNRFNNLSVVPLLNFPGGTLFSRVDMW